MAYTGGAAKAPTPSGRLSWLPFLGVALVLIALRLVTSSTPAVAAAGGTPQPATAQTWLFAGIWIVTYLVEATAGWLLWRRRRRPYGRPALVVFWVLLGLQVLRLLNLLGSRLSAGEVPWSAFGTAVVLDLVMVVALLVAWPASRAASALLTAALVWLLVVTMLTGADALAQNGLPFA